MFKQQEYKTNHNTVEFYFFVVLLILLIKVFDDVIDEIGPIHQ